MGYSAVHMALVVKYRIVLLPELDRASDDGFLVYDPVCLGYEHAVDTSWRGLS